jgi:RNA polymerase-binding transcription factor DksA
MDTVVARKRLEEIRDELDRSIAVLGGSGPQQPQVPEYPQDPADAGANLTETQRSAAMVTAAQQQRSEVLSALTRIEEGSYGVCTDCGAKVPAGRLEARPEAARCVACQGKRDRLRR